ncbi:thermonuclease family protein [Bordetella sp. 2513F-2]
MPGLFHTARGRSPRNRLVRRAGGALGALVLAVAGALAHRYFPSGGPSGESAAPASRPAATGSPAGAAQARGGVPAAVYTLAGTVTQVPDGDTVTLRTAEGNRRIRLDSIDAPEVGSGSAQPGQPHSAAARRNLSALVEGRRVTAWCYETDQYERHVCALMLDDGSSANRAQVEAGYAWAYTARRGDYLRDQAMPALQRQAREAGRGLWAQPGAVEPWKWRYDCWRQRRCD